jgi:hypothetical protein
MEALSLSETSVLTRATLRNIPEDVILEIILFAYFTVIVCKVNRWKNDDPLLVYGAPVCSAVARTLCLASCRGENLKSYKIISFPTELSEEKFGEISRRHSCAFLGASFLDNLNWDLSSESYVKRDIRKAPHAPGLTGIKAIPLHV